MIKQMESSLPQFEWNGRGSGALGWLIKRSDDEQQPAAGPENVSGSLVDGGVLEAGKTLWRIELIFI